jgi:hypothetical protein
MSNSQPTPTPDTLDAIVEAIVEQTTARSGRLIVEGRVMSAGPPPYRRLDCGHRAVAYLHCRPRKGAVRVDVSGLWLPAGACVLRVPGSTGAATLMVRDLSEVPLAVRFLHRTVLRTLAAEADWEARRAGGRPAPVTARR